MKRPTGPLETARAYNARNCLAMLVLNPRALLDDRVREHVALRLDEFVAELRAGGRDLAEARQLLADLAEEAEMGRTRLFRTPGGSHARDRLSDMVQACLDAHYRDTRP